MSAGTKGRSPSVAFRGFSGAYYLNVTAANCDISGTDNGFILFLAGFDAFIFAFYTDGAVRNGDVAKGGDSFVTGVCYRDSPAIDGNIGRVRLNAVTLCFNRQAAVVEYNHGVTLYAVAAGCNSECAAIEIDTIVGMNTVRRSVKRQTARALGKLYIIIARQRVFVFACYSQTASSGEDHLSLTEESRFAVLV